MPSIASILTGLPAVRQALEPRLDTFLRGGADGPAELSPEAREALRSLGYLQ